MDKEKRYIDADLVLKKTQKEVDALMDIYYRHKSTLSDKMLTRLDGVIHGLESACYRIKNAPTADVQAFFTEDEIALINEYKDAVEAVDFKMAILNAVAVSLDRADYEPTKETNDRFSEFTNAQDALTPLFAHFKGDE